MTPGSSWCQCVPRSSSQVRLSGPRIPVVAALDKVLQPYHLVAVVVVVGLVDVAERIDRELIRVAEVLRQHLEARAIRVHAQRHALEVAFAIAFLPPCPARRNACRTCR